MKIRNTAIIVLFLFILISAIKCQVEYFPGLRRPPSVPLSTNDEILAQLNKILEEQARRRLQQQLVSQHHFYQQHQQHGPNSQNRQNNKPNLLYIYPDNQGQSLNDKDQFAFPPTDPRYFQISNNNKINMAKDYYTDDKIDPDTELRNYINNKISDEESYYELKTPMNVNPKIDHVSGGTSKTIIRDDINSLVEKLQREGQANTILNRNYHQPNNEVIRKHMGIESALGMYIVALIAGISAAITVGIIALGIGWYTLQKRSKAAADVEYPAYGITGPNKDISPSGDRRLAQSAQMYHYQHQKQQIIAMENRNNVEQNGVSDVESDDDNEEGDYTVYECPGFASTGEIEVKNPLFLDDTPVTPAVNVTDTSYQQPIQQKSINDENNLSKSTAKNDSKTNLN